MVDINRPAEKKQSDLRRRATQIKQVDCGQSAPRKTDDPAGSDDEPDA